MAAALTLAQRTNLISGWTNEFIAEYPIFEEAMKMGSIKYDMNVEQVSERVKLDYQTNTLRTWTGLTPMTAAQDSEMVTATYTTGQYYDTTTVEPSLLERIKNDKNKVFDVTEEALSELRGRVKDQLYDQMRQGDGNALVSGSGTTFIGYNTVVPASTSGLSVNGIAVSSSTNYAPQVIDGDDSVSGDFDSDRVHVLGAMETRLTYRTSRGVFKPTVAFVSRDLANTFQAEEMADKIRPPSGGGVAQHGFDTQVFRGPSGLRYMMDDDVSANTIEYWNLSPQAFEIWTPYKRKSGGMGGLMKMTEKNGRDSYVAEPPIFEVRLAICIRWRSPRAFGKVINANAAKDHSLI